MNTSDASRLTSEYTHARQGHPVEVRRGGARSFFARFGSPAGWEQASLQDQLAVGVRARQFASWLIVTGKATPSADYLLSAHGRLGVLADQVHPDLSAGFCTVGEELGFPPIIVRRHWAALIRIAALAGVDPRQVSADQVEAATEQLIAASQQLGHAHTKNLTSAVYGLQAVLFHLGIHDRLPARTNGSNSRRRKDWDALAVRAPDLAATMRRYLEQIAVSMRANTVAQADTSLRLFAAYLTAHHPHVHSVASVERAHIVGYKRWLAERPGIRGPRLANQTLRGRLSVLRVFFDRIIEWGDQDAPTRTPIFGGDLPIKDDPLPRFIDDAAAAKLLVAVRADPDPFARLAIEMLARTGLRKSELLALTTDSVVQIGSSFWLRVPVGKLHTDRYIPLHPQLKQLIDDWLDDRPDRLKSNLLFVERGRQLTASRLDGALARVASTAGIGHVSPHQLRHTLATQAINRGMSLEALAALLGHKSLSMTLIYARIADRTVANEYFAVSEKVESLYGQPRQLPADAEGTEMTKLRRESERRMLGNGYCARPVELDCHFDTICETCTYFVTTVDFKPTLRRQRDDAASKGQIGRQHVYEDILNRLDNTAS